MYVVSNVDYSIENKKILNNIDIKINKGEFIGILGPNGSGKSTLLRVLLNYLKKETGLIDLKEKSIEKYKQKEIAKIVSFVPQKSKVSMPISVDDFILLGRLPHRKSYFESYSEKDFNEVRRAMKLLNIENFKDRDVNTLSGGEFQRVLMARALCQNPEILILDEATAAMDINYSIKLMDMTETLSKNENLTVIAVLHDLNLASLYCSKIIFLKEGEVRHFGEVEDLFKEDILEEIYDFKCSVINNKYGKPFVLPLKGAF
jgi:ABC-type cobalamin/Fe3+-siderophores transport systems, ATPase components